MRKICICSGLEEGDGVFVISVTDLFVFSARHM